MKLDYIDKIELEKQINTFIEFGNNDYYNFSKQELRQIFLDNPKSVTFIKPDGTIITDNLKPSEHHYIAFFKYLNCSNEDNKIKSANELCNKLINNNYIVIYSFLEPTNLNKMYGIKRPIIASLEQEYSLEKFKKQLNLDSKYLMNNDKNNETYFIPFEEFEKSKTK